MRRRDFVKIGSVLAASSKPLHASFKGTIENTRVDFIQDGLLLGPLDYANLLVRLADERKINPDSYSNGGVVAELEDRFARLLGQESAVFLPTGTLANHLAVRRLSGGNTRVIVQEQSHIYNDSGDCAQVLSGLNLIPLGLNGVRFSLDDVRAVIEKTKLGRVETQVGVIMLETPVRRQQDRIITYEQLEEITTYSRANGIKTHLDGARLFVQSVHSGKEPSKFGRMFDTVYTSLWKCFNASSGAVLAGSKQFTQKLFHERRMFGGSLPAAWAFAAVALHYADSFIEDYQEAWSKALDLFSRIERSDNVTVTRFDDGTHMVKLTLRNTNVKKFRDELGKMGIDISYVMDDGCYLKINPSINRSTAEKISSVFDECLAKSTL